MSFKSPVTQMLAEQLIQTSIKRNITIRISDNLRGESISGFLAQGVSNAKNFAMPWRHLERVYWNQPYHKPYKLNYDLVVANTLESISHFLHQEAANKRKHEQWVPTEYTKPSK